MSMDSLVEPLAPPATPAPSIGRVGLKRLLIFLLPANVAMYAMYQGIQQILIPAQVQSIDPAAKIANLALLTTITSITAVIGLLSGGALSDRTRGRFGRRAPWLVIGAALSAGLMCVMGLTAHLIALAVVYATLWFWGNFYQAALTATLPDRVPESRRGVASSVLGLGVPLGVLVGVNLAARVPQATGYVILAGFLLATTALFVAFAREEAFHSDVSAGVSKSAPLGPRGLAMRGLSLFESFASPDFAFAFISRALMFLAIFTVNGYLFYFLQDRIGPANLPQHSAKIGASLLATIFTAAWIVTVTVAGWVADRMNRRKAFVAVCSLGTALTMMIPVFSATWIGMVFFQVGIGVFFGSYMAIDLALMSLVLPKKSAEGRDMAVLAVATAGPQILSPVIAGGIITLLGYNELFYFGALTSLGGAMVVMLIKKVR